MGHPARVQNTVIAEVCSLRIPRRIILSRKGFDTSYGGCASPIFQDGHMVSFPIPERNKDTKVRTTYGDLHPALGRSIPEMISSLHPKDSEWSNKKVHLDPDIRPELRQSNNKVRRGFFGQANGSQTTLAKGQVHNLENDALFLFYGYFRKVEGSGSKLRYVRFENDNQHVIWGWLQVGSSHTISSRQGCEQLSGLDHHPHIQDYDRKNNSLYIGREYLSFDETKAGFGVFDRYHPDLRLTSPVGPMSSWKVPNFLVEAATGGVEKQWNKPQKDPGSFSYRGPGQEFIFDTSNHEDETKEWLAKLFSHS